MAEQQITKFNPTSDAVNKRILRRVANQKKKSGLSKQSIGSISFLVILFFILLLPNLFTPVSTTSADLVSYAVSKSTVTIDGVVQPNEYSSYYKDPNLGVQIYSEHTATTIYFGLICPATGWCAMGFNVPGETAGMANADIKFGTMVNGSLVLSDRHSRFNGDPPKVDPNNYTNILNYVGKVANGKTTFEFSIKLNSGTDGGYDMNLAIGQKYTIIYAFHNNYDFVYHGQNRNMISFYISANKN